MRFADLDVNAMIDSLQTKANEHLDRSTESNVITPVWIANTVTAMVLMDLASALMAGRKSSHLRKVVDNDHPTKM